MNPGPRTHKQASLRVAIAEGLPVEMWEKTREIVGVQSLNQRKGHATALMWTVCAEADRAWLTLVVQPKSFANGMGDDKLIAWYSRFGFVKIQDTPVLMARSPQAPAVARAHG